MRVRLSAHKPGLSPPVTLSLTVPRRYSHLSLNNWLFVSVSIVFFSHLHSCYFLVLVLCCSVGWLLCMLCFLHELFPLVVLAYKQIPGGKSLKPHMRSDWTEFQIKKSAETPSNQIAFCSWFTNEHPGHKMAIQEQKFCWYWKFRLVQSPEIGLKEVLICAIQDLFIWITRRCSDFQPGICLYAKTTISHVPHYFHHRDVEHCLPW